MDHMVIAAACLILSGISIAASLITALWPTLMRFLGGPAPIFG
jgi:hypothetical protein